VGRLDSWLGPLAGVTVLVALWLIFIVVPTEAQMGIVQRIFYFHVPCAWVTFVCFFIVAGASVRYLWTRSERADRLAVAAAEVGVLFCTLVLVTGPIWARPIWGVWWTWDPRLTMTVILWAIYLAYVMLRAFGAGDEQVASYAAVLGIVGVLDIPVIRVSARLLSGMHPAVMTTREGGSGLADPSMRMTLYVSALGLSLVAAWLLVLRWRLEGLEREGVALRHEIDDVEEALA
jgi:heme exporter protein C